MSERGDFFDYLLDQERQERASKLDTAIRTTLIEQDVYRPVGEWAILCMGVNVGHLKLQNDDELSRVSLITADSLLSSDCDGNYIFQGFEDYVPRITTIDSYADSMDMHHYYLVPDKPEFYREFSLDETIKFEKLLASFLIGMCEFKTLKTAN